MREGGAAEYLGALLLVSVVVAVLVTSGVGGQIAEALDRAVCEIAGGDCEGDAGSGPDVAGPEAPRSTCATTAPGARSR